MDKKALINSKILKFLLNDRTDKIFLAQPKINLQSFKSTTDSLKQRLKAVERKRSLGAPEKYGMENLTFEIISLAAPLLKIDH